MKSCINKISIFLWNSFLLTTGSIVFLSIISTLKLDIFFGSKKIRINPQDFRERIYSTSYQQKASLITQINQNLKSKNYKQINSIRESSETPTIRSPKQGFCHPLKGRGFLSQGVRGFTHVGRTEYAYDFGTPIGSPVYAMQTGRVIGIEDRYSDFGGSKANIDRVNYIWIEHKDMYRSAYLHLQKRFNQIINLQSGSWVRKGQLIGYSGNSGWTTAPHLHVEIQAPGGYYKFTQTVPFAIQSTCFFSKNVDSINNY